MNMRLDRSEYETGSVSDPVWTLPGVNTLITCLPANGLVTIVTELPGFLTVICIRVVKIKISFALFSKEGPASGEMKLRCWTASDCKQTQPVRRGTQRGEVRGV